MYKTKKGSLEYSKDNIVCFTVKLTDAKLARLAISNGEQFLERVIPGCSTVVTNSGEDGKPGVIYGVNKEKKEGFETQRDRGDDELWQLVAIEEADEDTELTSFEYRVQVGQTTARRTFRVVVELSDDKVKIIWSDNPVLLSCMEMTDLVAPLFCLMPLFRKREKGQMDQVYLRILERLHTYLNEYDPALYPNKATYAEAEEVVLKSTL